MSQFAFQVHQTELYLRRGEIEAATRHLRAWENNIDTLKTPQRFHPEFIKRLTRAAFAGTPDQVTFLLAHLTAARGQAQVPVYQLAATVLEKAGNPAGAAEDLMRLMTEHRIRHLPVTADGVLAGIISIGDVVKQRLAEMEDEQQAMREYIATA